MFLIELIKAIPVSYTHLDVYKRQEKYGAKIYLKKENAQRVRSFKIRGAYFAISQLSKEERERGVVCASAGNHAQGVAYTCNEMKIPATIFMPDVYKRQWVGYGCRLVSFQNGCKPSANAYQPIN